MSHGEEAVDRAYKDKLSGKMSEFLGDAMTVNREVMRNFESKVKETRTFSYAQEEISSRESHGPNRCFGMMIRAVEGIL